MGPECFDKKSRLLSKNDFDYLKQAPSKYSTSSLIFFYKKTKLMSDKTRIGFSISRKVGKSNIRNRLRRVMREYFRLSPYRDIGLDILVVVKNKLSGKENIKNFENLILNDLNFFFKNLSK